MDRIKINLLPQEIKEAAKKEQRKFTIVKLSVGVLGLLILATSVLLSMVILQKTNITKINQAIEEDKSKTTSLQDKEILVTLLKSRLDDIHALGSQKYTQGQTFELITSLFPPDVQLSSLIIDKSAKVTLHGETVNPASLKVFFDKVSDPAQNEGKISSARLDSISKGANNKIQFDLIINLSQS